MSNFIHAAGVNGFIKTPFKLLDSNTGLDTGLSALASGGAVTSAHGGANTNGIFSQSDFGNAQYARLWFNAGASIASIVAGGNLSGWWLVSIDGGTTFEGVEATASTTVPALGRPPDFVINMYEAATIAASDKKMSQIVQLPYESCKVILQNNTGVALGTSTANQLWCGPVADTYG